MSQRRKNVGIILTCSFMKDVHMVTVNESERKTSNCNPRLSGQVSPLALLLQEAQCYSLVKMVIHGKT